MSRIYFHSPSRTTEVSGSERAWFSVLCSRFGGHMLVDDGASLIWRERMPRLLELIAPDHYLRRMPLSAPELLMAVGGFGSSEVFHWRGRPIRGFSLQLNTAMALGSNPIRLAARLHGQCEIHAWAEAEDCGDLADVIEEGLATDVMRRGRTMSAHPGEQPKFYSNGWEAVIAHLRECHRGDEPIVTSYSVCEQFPNFSSSGLSDKLTWRDPPKPWPDGYTKGDNGVAWETRSEEFQAMERADQWHLCMEQLRATESSMERQMRPSVWSSMRFTHELTFMDLVAEDRDARLDAWFAREKANAERIAAKRAEQEKQGGDT